jgi:hypothetical protein
MQWDIEVRPVSNTLDNWTWWAARADQENNLYGRPDTPFATADEALENAKARVRNFERKAARIAASVVVVTYSPTAEELE